MSDLENTLKNMVYLDTETTGIDDEDRLCQVAYRIDGENHESLFKPPLPIKIEASAVCHITNKMVEEKEAFEGSKMQEDIKAIFADKKNILVAHNAKFDIKMLNKEGIDVPNFIDTLKVAQKLDTEGKIPRYNLQYLRYFLELEVEGAQAHDALGDVLVLEKLFERLYIKMEDSGLDYDQIVTKMIEMTLEPVLLRRFNFGKYKDMQIEDVAKKDRGYLEWLLKEKEKQKADGDEDEDWIFTLNYHLNK